MLSRNDIQEFVSYDMTISCSGISNNVACVQSVDAMFHKVDVLIISTLKGGKNMNKAHVMYNA